MTLYHVVGNTCAEINGNAVGMWYHFPPHISTEKRWVAYPYLSHVMERTLRLILQSVHLIVSLQVGNNMNEQAI
jgi:hypothetical protein